MSRSSFFRKRRQPSQASDIGSNQSAGNIVSDSNTVVPEEPRVRGGSEYSSDSEIFYQDGNTPQHRLYERRRPKEEANTDEPPILWTTRVFRVHNDTGSATRTPTAIYCDDQPLNVTFREKQKDSLPSDPTSSAKEDLSASSQRPTWTGCVFEVSCWALAHFPMSSGKHSKGHTQQPAEPPKFEALLRRSTTGSFGRVQNLPDASKPQPVTSRFESLKFDKISRSAVVIKSPYLYDILKDVAGYYPSFFAKRYHTNTFPASPTEIPTDRLEIPDPWGILFHRLSELEAFVQTQPTISEVQKAKLNNEELRLHFQREHVSHLCRFLKPFYDSRVLPCRKALEQPAPQLPFDMLWYAFAPGTDVYVQSGESLLACVVAQIMSNLDDDGYSTSQLSQFERKYWVLDLWYLDSDGQRIGRVPTTCRIAGYPGLRNLTSLEACPAVIWDVFDKGERRKRIMKRNTLLARSLQRGHLLAWHDGPTSDGKRYYTGSVVVDRRRGLLHTKNEAPVLGNVKDHCSQFKRYDDVLVYAAEDMTGDVIMENADDGEDEGRSVRPASSRQLRAPDDSAASNRAVRALTTDGTLGGNSITNSSTTYHSTSRIGDAGSQGPSAMVNVELSEHQLLILCPRTQAFALKTKLWLVIQADNISEVSPSEESIANLVLDEAELKTIRALSTRQNSKRDIWAADFIEGKGTGQIILLHGPPGVGKTYTVEAIAEHLYRPLLSLTVADIGTMETRVERELLRWFTLAEAWNAVLLVDEADIFLERRQNRDLARNGLVSAFLRRMEYFRGLLFLTTNRVGQIDDAFISRVHVAIGYKPLSAEGRSKIWQGFFRKLVKERAGKIQISSAARKWVLEKAESGQAQLNGRDIRNALQTAITLAEAESEEDPDFDPLKMPVVVDQAHFERVLDISNKFHEYVKSIRREDEKKRAAALEWRNDYWKPDKDC